MDYEGIIIQESLTNFDILKELEIVHTEIEKVTRANETPWLEQWTMHTVVIKKDKMDDYAQKLSQLIDSKHCNNWYCDFKNEELHYVVFRNKVFKLDKHSKQDYTNMKEYAIKLGLPEHQLPNPM